MNECKVLLFNLRLQGLILDLKVQSSGSRIMCLFSSPGIFICFLLVEREGHDLGVGLRGRGRLCSCALHSGSSSVFLSLLEEKLLILKASLLNRRFNLRESLSLGRNGPFFPTLGGILFSLRMTFSP